MMHTHSDNSLNTYPIIDTHTHFDDGVFDEDRFEQAQSAYESGVQHLVLIGYLAKYFERMVNTYSAMEDWFNKGYKVPQSYQAFGLHPAYISQHKQADLDTLKQMLDTYPHVAIGEIGLDTFTDALKTEASVARQKQFFEAQLDLAVAYKRPVLLHIRKAHAECLAILKQHQYDAHKLGGIAHSFSGGEQEAKAFVKLGFKLGVTGQVTNTNAKKLRRALSAAVEEYGLDCLVLETDCPDMTPVCCQVGHEQTRNVPANLKFVLHTLSELFEVAPEALAKQLWKNSLDALKVDWSYPHL